MADLIKNSLQDYLIKWNAGEITADGLKETIGLNPVLHREWETCVHLSDPPPFHSPPSLGQETQAHIEQIEINT